MDVTLTRMHGGAILATWVGSEGGERVRLRDNDTLFGWSFNELLYLGEGTHSLRDRTLDPPPETVVAEGVPVMGPNPFTIKPTE